MASSSAGDEKRCLQRRSGCQQVAAVRGVPSADRALRPAPRGRTTPLTRPTRRPRTQGVAHQREAQQHQFPVMLATKTCRKVRTSSKGIQRALPVPRRCTRTHNVVAKVRAWGYGRTNGPSESGTKLFNTTVRRRSRWWGDGTVDGAPAPAMHLFNGATVHSATTNSTGSVNTRFTTSCQHGSTNWVVNVIQGGSPAQAQGTFTPTC